MDDACGGSGVRTIVSATSKYAGLSTAISWIFRQFSSRFLYLWTSLKNVYL
jgi:hypothetical protein